MTTSGPQRNSKVARVIDEYDLVGMGERLEASWTGDGGERTSLRDLADEFNRSVLESAITDSGGTALSSDVETTYDVLTGDDVSEADRMRKRRELEQDGVDVDRVRDDFVTHQAIHTYLTKYRDAELPDRSADRVQRKIETLERLQGRTSVVAESTIEGLVNSEDLTDREYEVFVDIQVVCSECGTGYAVGELIRQGGCDC
ncbi:rod-determining factor RdfA [Halorarum halobium]|uniref:rod-determining factor RdfA n=1 Tax=Halorarum halobium TaxID=3075121 RepID=UPI0028AD9E2E|nr:rod-determining factor RdfA [Halobaculum sp. XH14]